MSYDYITLCNEVLRGMNETIFSDTSTFSSATGFHAYVKDKVNTAIEETLNAEDNNWPFQYSSLSQVLVAGTQEYSLDATVVTVDWDSFYIAYDALITAAPYAKRLPQITWDNYRDNYLISDKNSTSSDMYNKPDFVVRTEQNKFIVTPKPDAAYTVVYKGFTLLTPLSASTDVPVIPQQFKQVIIDRAQHYVALFRDNFEQAGALADKWTLGLRAMRRSLISQPDTMRSI
jgi:hypothetical protein